MYDQFLLFLFTYLYIGVFTDETSFYDDDKAMSVTSLLLELHVEHCGDTALCSDKNHVEPALPLFPVPCCVPCSCLPTCVKQKNCCPSGSNETMAPFTYHWEYVTETYTQSYVGLNDALNNNVQNILQAEHTTDESRDHDSNRQGDIISLNGNETENESSNVRTISTDFICKRSQVFYFPNFYIDFEAYEIVKSCPHGYADKIVSEKCLTDFKNNDLLDIIPVTSQLSGITFANKYCFLCNEPVTAKNSLGYSWRVEIVFALSEYVHIFYPDIQLVHRYYQDFVYVNSNIHFVPTKPHLARHCKVYDVTSCNETGLWEEYNETIATICRYGNTLPILQHFNGMRRLFRNIACVHCNARIKTTEGQLRCGHILHNDLPISSLLLNTADTAGETDEKSLHYIDDTVVRLSRSPLCPGENVTVLGLCRTVFCPRDHYMRGRKCVPLYDVLTGLDLNFQLKITPNRTLPKAALPEFVEQLKDLVNSTISSSTSLQSREISLWHSRRSVGNPKEYYLFNMLLFNTSDKINYAQAVSELKCFFEKMVNHKSLLLSNGVNLGLKQEISHSTEIFLYQILDVGVIGSPNLSHLMGDGWKLQVPRPYMKISDISWCYRAVLKYPEEVESPQSPNDGYYRIKQLKMALYQDQYDFEWDKNDPDSLFLYVCLHLLTSPGDKMKGRQDIENDSDSEDVETQYERNKDVYKGLASVFALFSLITVVIICSKIKQVSKRNKRLVMTSTAISSNSIGNSMGEQSTNLDVKDL